LCIHLSITQPWLIPSPDEKGRGLSLGPAPHLIKNILAIETLITEFMENACLKEEESSSRGTMNLEDCCQWPVSQEG